ncbi:MAG: hypothetical protein ABIH59_02265 [archaeon]
MNIKGVDAKAILDSRKEKTISVSIKTNVGTFSASSPSGKSTGKYESKIYKKSLEEDIKTLKKFKVYFSEEIIENFDDLRRIEDIMDGHIGANSLFALESAVLKALAKEQKKQVWELINENAKNFPRLVGNCIGGGKHNHTEEKKPDFQEFLLIPNTKTIKQAFEKNKEIQSKVEQDLKEIDKNFKGEKNDENAWITSLNEKEILDILKKLKVPLGIDVAASSFYKRKKYHYENPPLDRTAEEQLGYLENLIKNFNLFYIEDGFNEEDFKTFSELLERTGKSLIVGDDLIATNSKRLEKALEKKSVNSIIVKPNQCGSLLEVKRVCGMAKKNNIKTVFSHRSGETEENILADLAFGFQADFFKCGISGKEREVKIKRLIEIEKSLRN